MPSWMQTLYWLQEYFWWIQAAVLLLTASVLTGALEHMEGLFFMVIVIPLSVLCSFVIAVTLAIALRDPSAIVVTCIDTALLVVAGRFFWGLRQQTRSREPGSEA